MISGKQKYIFVMGVFAPLLLGLLLYVTPNFQFGFIRNYVADFLWMMAFTFSVLIINQNWRSKWLWLAAILLISFLWEWMQSLQPFPGTFDLIDTFVYLCAWLCSIVIYEVL